MSRFFELTMLNFSFNNVKLRMSAKTDFWRYFDRGDLEERIAGLDSGAKMGKKIKKKLWER